jgi:retron-type reverse transcriptase
MRRHGKLWQKVISWENLQTAYYNAARHKGSMRNVKKFAENEVENLKQIQTTLIEKTFTTSPYTEKKVYEPKERVIYVLPFAPDRIVQHALMNVLIPIWDNFFINDSYACRKGKGIHAGSVRTMAFVRRNKYVLKCDISKFYPSINQDILIAVIKRKIKCPDTLWLIEDIIRSFPGGKNVPIGNYTSQWFGNLYLNELDRYVKQELKIKDYIRYCDDFCLFHNDKKVLKDCRDKIDMFINERLKLTFSKCDVFPVSRGVDFLGYRHFDNYLLLRKSTAKRVRKRLAALPKLYEKGKVTGEQYRSSVASAYGWLKRANTYNLRVKIQLDELKKRRGNWNE